MSRVASHAYDFIREQILSGALTPGEQLREDALAEACGVSRTPVREALRKLEVEQLIQRNGSQRTFVTMLSSDEIAESFTLRAMLEGHAAARAAERIEAEQIETLVAHNHAICDILKGSDPDISAFIKCNRGFHATISAAASSSRLSALLGSIVEQPIVMGTAQRYSRDQLSRSLADHNELIVAFRHRDPEWARAVMIGHIRRAFHVFSDAMLPTV